MFLAFGDPKRLRIVELPDWTGKAVAGPRSEFEKVIEREESLNSGVYFLTGIDSDSWPLKGKIDSKCGLILKNK